MQDYFFCAALIFAHRARCALAIRASPALVNFGFQSKERPEISETLLPAGQGQGLRVPSFDDFLRCVHDRNWKPESPTRDSIEVLEIIEKAYLSTEKGGILVPLR